MLKCEEGEGSKGEPIIYWGRRGKMQVCMKELQNCSMQGKLRNSKA